MAVFIRAVVLLSVVLFVIAEAQQWSGNFGSKIHLLTRTKTVCAYSTWTSSCRLYKIIWEPYQETRYFCLPGWEHSGDYNCNQAICEPRCENGGTCIQPNNCICSSPYQGPTCGEGTAGNSTYRVTPGNDLAVQEFLTKAKTMQQMEEFLRLREFASARDEDRELLHRRRKERMKKEEISRNRVARKKRENEEIQVINESDEEMNEDMDQIMKDLDQFDKTINKNQDVDSD